MERLRSHFIRSTALIALGTAAFIGTLQFTDIEATRTDESAANLGVTAGCVAELRAERDGDTRLSHNTQPGCELLTADDEANVRIVRHRVESETDVLVGVGLLSTLAVLGGAGYTARNIIVGVRGHHS